MLLMRFGMNDIGSRFAHMFGTGTSLGGEFELRDTSDDCFDEGFDAAWYRTLGRKPLLSSSGKFTVHAPITFLNGPKMSLLLLLSNELGSEGFLEMIELTLGFWVLCEAKCKSESILCFAPREKFGSASTDLSVASCFPIISADFSDSKDVYEFFLVKYIRL